MDPDVTSAMQARILAMQEDIACLKANRGNVPQCEFHAALVKTDQSQGGDGDRSGALAKALNRAVHSYVLSRLSYAHVVGNGIARKEGTQPNVKESGVPCSAASTHAEPTPAG